MEKKEVENEMNKEDENYEIMCEEFMNDWAITVTEIEEDLEEMIRIDTITDTHTLDWKKIEENLEKLKENDLEENEKKKEKSENMKESFKKLAREKYQF